MDGMHDDATLATGRIEARFHCFGTTADETDKFIISVSGLANMREMGLTKIYLIPNLTKMRCMFHG